MNIDVFHYSSLLNLYVVPTLTFLEYLDTTDLNT
jgi:hypothetical protein